MNTIQTQNDIIEDFKVLEGDLEMTLNYLIELGEALDVLEEKHKIDENIVKGCQSKVWLTCTKKDDKIIYQGDSNTSITKGLLSILIKIFNNKTSDEIIKTDLENDLLYLKGSIPGSKNSTVFLRESIKNISRKTLKEKHEAKIKEAAAKKGKK